MADPSNDYPEETPKVISSGPGVVVGKGLENKKKSGVKAGSYNRKKRQAYEDMLKEAGS
jgi:hypothetical protein